MGMEENGRTDIIATHWMQPSHTELMAIHMYPHCTHLHSRRTFSSCSVSAFSHASAIRCATLTPGALHSCSRYAAILAFRASKAAPPSHVFRADASSSLTDPSSFVGRRASESGVEKHASSAATSAPSSTRHLTESSCPTTTAQCSGVRL